MSVSVNQQSPEASVHRNAGLLWCVFFISAGVLAFEVSAMRMLLVAGYHHFAFMVISIALLGFGASGTALCLTRRWVLRRPGPVLLGLTAAAAISMPIVCILAQHMPIQARIVPGMKW